MPKRTRSYEDSLRAALRDPAEAAAYLNAHLEEKGKGAQKLFLMALRDVAAAFGMKTLAHKASVGRESLYKSLAKAGNPRLSTLVAVLRAMGLELTVTAKGNRTSRPRPSSASSWPSTAGSAERSPATGNDRRGSSRGFSAPSGAWEPRQEKRCRRSRRISRRQISAS
jgi:probable addiction module antidote protein